MKIHKKHSLYTILLLAVEITIAIVHFHPFIRGFVGDVLVIILLYHLVLSFFSISSEKLIVGLLLFSFGIELLQLAGISEAFENTPTVIKVITGTTFDPWDIVAYLTGGFLLYVFQKKRKKK
ncbi:ribosomal maturation YjgA family protein [Ulvibacter litoralis]|uniref:DUF2809 domain-containing protein n=1 Tax=Ulvibacter litoralis TaxID=227084 RepID=A0A1G7ILJ3_9FLAO|nr:DUF2809 domain-containing protein [Ulvibacter litoralis]GHC61256.1 hypothetical protein GCM10008083_27970 [Ulvibacter litoralis]SDF13597.1 Protein of unknown function [Ulvibacter litoralis]